MNSITEANPLGTEKISLLLKKFAVPSIVAMLVSSLYNIVDQIFIGQGVGYLGNAATNVAFPFTTISLALSLLVGIGSASRFSIELGRKNVREAGECVGNAFWMTLVLGIIYCVLAEIFLTPMLKAFGATPNVLPYAVSYVRITAAGMPFLMLTNIMSNLIRADGSPSYSMNCMILGAVINTILDPIFIFTLDMGVAGAAIATVISQVVSFVPAIMYLGKFKRVSLAGSFMHPSIKKSLKIASFGLSNSLNQVSILIVQIVMNNSLTYYGALSVYGEDIPLSAFGIVMKVNSIFISVFIGIHQGAQPIIGFNYGAKQYDRVKKVFLQAVGWSMVVSTLGFIAFQFFPRSIVSLFGAGDELYYEFAIKAMRIFLLMIIVSGIQLLSANFFSAIGKPLKGVILSLSRQFIILIPLILILPLRFGIDGIMYAGPSADFSAFVISIFFIIAEFRKMNKAVE